MTLGARGKACGGVLGRAARKPLCVDLFCGLGGWAQAFLAEGWDVIGLDVERHCYGLEAYPGVLILQSVLDLHGRMFKGASCIVASPPCQEFSYMAMPWSRGKQIAAALRGQGEFPAGYTGSRTVGELRSLFDACFRIQREAAGRHIPMVVENVRGAIPWVGRSAWNYGAWHLWGDVPALMPFATESKEALGMGTYVPGGTAHRNYSSKSPERKAASAQIAKIPFPLASHIARVYKPLASDPGSDYTK